MLFRTRSLYLYRPELSLCVQVHNPLLLCLSLSWLHLTPSSLSLALISGVREYYYYVCVDIRYTCVLLLCMCYSYVLCIDTVLLVHFHDCSMLMSPRFRQSSSHPGACLDIVRLYKRLAMFMTGAYVVSLTSVWVQSAL